MGQTIVEKIAKSHLMEGPARRLRAGDVVSLRPRHVLTHDNTAAVMTKFEAIGARGVADQSQPVFVLDHDIQNESEENLAKYDAIAAFALEQGIHFYPAGTGIGHQIMMSHGYVTPGALAVASDSHANMYGALGALGTPVVRTDAAAIWATGEFWWQIPRTVQVVLRGRLRPGVTGKDLIITLCGLYNRGEVLNAALEFSGDGVASLGMAERMTIANMTTEWGALVGWFPVDAVTTGYLRERAELLGARGGFDRFSEQEMADWESDPPAPDRDAVYAGRIELDLESVVPHVSGPDTVQVMHPVSDLEREVVRVHKAYILSCVNSRLEDLDAAAGVLEGRAVAEGVELYVAAASAEIQASAEASGTWGTLLAAGARPLPAGCGPCIGLGTGLLESGEVGISATNRNFKGRMGSRDAKAYLASPEVVAESAVAGYIRGPVRLDGRGPEYRFSRLDEAPDSEETVQILDGFPERVRGRLVLAPQDNLNTDGIYGKDWTYREGMSQTEMAEVVMRNYDPEFASRIEAGDILVGGFNFGTGSSREQAATALQAAGIPLVIAGSFSQTYLRNAFNNGLLCIECPALVDRLREVHRSEIGAGARTLIPGSEIQVDFSRGLLVWNGESFRFPALGSVPQGLVVAGGIERQIRSRLGLGERN
ncbi:MAG: homoaconitase [marine benthic group bacterium]|nr:homoaconitase [Gemmatimonadota bacterium]MCL7973032.1 homoaconitase [Gemmatimonadota bacterium]